MTRPKSPSQEPTSTPGADEEPKTLTSEIIGSDILPEELSETEFRSHQHPADNRDLTQIADSDPLMQEVHMNGPSVFQPSSLPMPPPQPMLVPGTIDVASFVKAQAEYIAKQTEFLQRPHSQPSPDSFQNLVQYSFAQGKYIEALSEVLRQLEVL